jgi:ABC-2 type transport system ATP-binding protein
MLSISHLSKKFDTKIAVDDISLSIEDGKILSLIGPNGSGKTTIVKIIAGLLHPTSGTVSVDGHDVVTDPVGAKSLIGYMPDEPTVWGTMTGEEFLHFTGALFGVPYPARKARIAELLALLHLVGIEKEFFAQYSRGSRQKFSIMAALVHEPKLLLIDEPIVGLDPGSATIAKHAFKEFAVKGGSVLLVTHTLSAAEELSDTVGFLKDSRMIAFGTPAEMRSQANLPPQASLDDVYEKLVQSSDYAS